MTGTVGEGKHTGDLEVVLEAGANIGRSIEDKNIVGFSSRDGIVVEVVDDSASPLRGKSNVELGEESGQGRRGRCLGGKGNENIAICVDKVDENVGGQVRAQGYIILALVFTHTHPPDSRVRPKMVPNSPFTLVGKRTKWSYVLSPRWNNLACWLLGVS